jgi:hypothetical protein
MPEPLKVKRVRESEIKITHDLDSGQINVQWPDGATLDYVFNVLQGAERAVFMKAQAQTEKPRGRLIVPQIAIKGKLT